ncbi:hypothetical protein F4604DRAFT_1924369 [Suillus subluteus]|nr:hypothetical protein F4604DRAFT_1924369 [Suillus subluteus]
MSRSSPPSSVVSRHDDHVRDLCQLLEGMTVSGSTMDTVTWRRKTVEETITLSKAPHPNSPRANQTSSVPALSASSRTHDPLPSSSDM